MSNNLQSEKFPVLLTFAHGQKILIAGFLQTSPVYKTATSSKPMKPIHPSIIGPVWCGCGSLESPLVWNMPVFGLYLKGKTSQMSELPECSEQEPVTIMSRCGPHKKSKLKFPIDKYEGNLLLLFDGDKTAKNGTKNTFESQVLVSLHTEESEALVFRVRGSNCASRYLAPHVQIFWPNTCMPLQFSPAAALHACNFFAFIYLFFGPNQN